MSAFRIIGDEIEYEFRPFARIVAPEYSINRADAENEILSWDDKEREAEDLEWQNNIEAEHAETVTELENKISDLESGNTKLAALLDAIEGGSTVAELIAAANKERDDWRKIAETNRAAYHEAIKPKPRKRRT